MPSINSQIQLPVIPWVLWTVCDYKNTAEDKTAIHLKLYTPPHQGEQYCQLLKVLPSPLKQC